MTAHQLAAKLLASPDLPVVINGWSSDEGFTFEVETVSEDVMSFRSVIPYEKDELGYAHRRRCLEIGYHQTQK